MTTIEKAADGYVRKSIPIPMPPWDRAISRAYQAGATWALEEVLKECKIHEIILFTFGFVPMSKLKQIIEKLRVG